MSSLRQLVAWVWLIWQYSSKLCRHLTQKRGHFVRQVETWPTKDAQFRSGLIGALICLVWLCLFAHKQRLLQLQLRMCPAPKQPGSANLQGIDFGVFSGVLLSGKNAAREAVTHSLSRVSGFSSGSFLPLCTLCSKKRDAV